MEKNTSKVVIGILVAALLIVVVGSIVLFQKNSREFNDQLTSMQVQANNLNQQLTQRDSVINDMMQTYDEIAKSIEEIKARRNIVTLNKSENGKIDRKAIANDIQTLDALLEDNKQKLANLNEKLRKSGIKITQLENKIAELNKVIEERDAELAEARKVIGEKDNQIASLNNTVNDMQVNLDKKDTAMVHQQNENAKVFYTIGTLKELKAKGLVEYNGGVLGLGRTKTIANEMNSADFKVADRRKVSSIPVNAAKAKLITEHPAGSYEFVEDKGQIASLEIKDADRFWKYSKYMVLEVK
jgi:uncharacterized coiled-coil protein SlyX